MRETVAAKAQRLEILSFERPGHSRQILAHGLVHGDHGIYYVTLYRGDVARCTCQWGQYHPDMDHPCSHALALRHVLEKEAL